MSDVNTIDSPATESLDKLFTLMAGEALAGARSPSRILAGDRFLESSAPSARLGPAGDASAGPAKPPPALRNSADVGAAYEWLQTERKRLEEYTRQQLGLIRQHHQALVAKEHASEESLVVRAQELNREVRFLASQAEVLKARARQLTQRETALAAQMGKVAKAQEEFLAIQQTSTDLRQDTAEQLAFLEGLQAETALLQEEEVDARTKFEACEIELRQRQQAWERKQAELDERQAEIEERYLNLERAEDAVQRRMAELDEMEDRLQQEVDTQEQKLATERRDLQIIWTTLSLQKLGPDDDDID